MDKFSKDWWVKALIRAVHTVAQTALAYVAVGMRFTDIDWVSVASVAGVAGLVSLLKSIAFGIPEGESDGVLQIDSSDPEKDLYMLQVDTPLDEVATKKSIRLIVNAQNKE